jgi:hypothetical protein
MRAALPGAAGAGVHPSFGARFGRRRCRHRSPVRFECSWAVAAVMCEQGGVGEQELGHTLCFLGCAPNMPLGPLFPRTRTRIHLACFRSKSMRVSQERQDQGSRAGLARFSCLVLLPGARPLPDLGTHGDSSPQGSSRQLLCFSVALQLVDGDTGCRV